MALFSIQNVEIKGIAACVPKQTIFNADLSFYKQETLQKLIETIGIESRRVANPHLCASDLCIAAANKIIADLSWKKSDIEVLVFVSQTPDYLVPGSAMHIQHKMGLHTSCLAIDINQGCAGFIYGLSVICSLLSSSKLKKGLLLVGDTITRNISPYDHSLIPLFSDAGSATAIEFNENAQPIVFNTSSQGENYDSIIIPEGGSRVPFSESTNEYSYIENDIKRKGSHLQMKGLDVFNFSLVKVIPNIEELLVYSASDKMSIQQFVFHQPNLLILNTLKRKLGLSSANFPISLRDYGNTSIASIPVTIVSQVAKNRHVTNQKSLLCGFGVGLSLGSAIVYLDKVVCPEIIEIE